MQFINFDIDGFLRDYWQKKPLLIKNPWMSWSNPLDPDELAGLACEEDVESRLITQSRDRWKAEHGPLPEARFSKLGKKPWTLLVQAVDHHVPDVAALIAPFRFIPNWRIDDVMVSYATDEGGVGPHFDQYDVFLIQGSGKRRWQVGGLCDAATQLLPHDDLRLLAHFEATDEWVLEPGDMLYVPPRVAHNGVAVGDDCMTYSVGFRAPSRSELIENWCDDLVGEMQDDDRYEDQNLGTQGNPGEISEDAIAALHAMVTEAMRDREAFARWFGQYSSKPKYPDMDWQPEQVLQIEDIGGFVADDVPLSRNPASRFSFIRQGEDCVLMFVDGECFECVKETIALAEQICAQDRVSIDPVLGSSESAMGLIMKLYNQGSVAFDTEG
ncbi:cupin domain-containing protein [Rhizorhapis suberifaciens]|uniref:50S ribosomal protein L16 3-hydroxylase n=1 Tax=Rhizorhapis suberifaciens TaxID=13656 RepID=A0A840HWA3_9SPHN|nr:cupin domain-containing protein [Rhizorhapis suberifaciens]MBB4641951.1 50S ribosomal protein L16 3-hydroxylase [Rhizorhapis suberifaciens]